MQVKTIGSVFLLLVMLLIQGCNDVSVWECAEGQKALDGVCVPKTCEADGYGCPGCDSDFETLFYREDGSGYCKITSCPEGEKVADINETAAECADQTCETDGFGCPACDADFESLFYRDDESGYCKITSCPEGEKVADINETAAECVDQTCEADGYGCPTCDPDFETLFYHEDGSGYCKITSCTEGEKPVDLNDTAAECIAQTCEADGFGCPACDPDFESVFYRDDESGYCKITSCPEGQKVVDINESSAECVDMNCRDDGFGCPVCGNGERLDYNTDGSGVCTALNCRDDAYGCPTCSAYEALAYDDAGEGECVSRACGYPEVGMNYDLKLLQLPMCKVQLENGEWINVDFGFGSGADSQDGKAYFITGNGLELDCSDHPGVCPGSASGQDKIFPLTSNEFAPAIVVFELNEAANRAWLSSIHPLRVSAGRTVSALFHPLMETNASQHAFTRTGSEVTYSPDAMDPEAIARVSSTGGFWLAEEYTSSLVYTNDSGLVSRRYVPHGWLFSAGYDVNDSFLPAALTRRVPHNGLKALALDEVNRKLYFMTAAPLVKDPDTTLRLYTADLNTDLTGIVSVSQDHNYTLDSSQSRVTAMHQLDAGRLLVVEQTPSGIGLYGLNLTENPVVKKALTVPEPPPGRTEGFSTDPMNASGRYFFIKDNGFGQDGAINRILFVDIDTSGV